MNRTKRSYFFENTSTTDANGNYVEGDRFRAEDIPSAESFKKLIDTTANVLEKEDRAKTDQQGLVKTTSVANVKAGTTPDNDYTYVAEVRNLPTVDSKSQTLDSISNQKLVDFEIEGSVNNKYKLKLSDIFISWLTATISDIKKSISDIEIPDIQGITSSITSLTGKAGNNETNISNLTTTVGVNSTSISENKTSIENNEQAIQTNANAIAAVNVNDGRFLGEVAWRSTSIAPNASWVKSDGSEISRTTYADLFAVIGTAYGAGDGSTTFNIPNLEGRSIRGNSSSFALASTGGSDTKTLVSDNLPTHVHGLNAVSGSEALNLSNSVGTDYSTVAAGNGSTDGTLDLDISTTGNSETNTTLASAFDVKNPYITLVPFIKISN